ncbi:MAG: hypothetical protein HN576_12795 [Bacteriovoracaceae bacterium]|jgi:hypothetical protein|nr:hypothetical protein [Bacteriovoracaceae bacterium]
MDGKDSQRAPSFIDGAGLFGHNGKKGRTKMKQKLQGMIKNLKEKETIENLSVALLLSDIEDCKNVSEVFREMGIIPHYYETLKDFWKGALSQMPSLAIVDVKLMSEGDRLLRNHPFVKTDQLPLCFFYNNENAPLVYSTFEMLNYGLIKKETNLRGQIKSALRRFNHSLEVNAKEKDFEIQSHKMERQVTTLISASEKLKEEDYYRNFLESVTSRFENKRNARDFNEALSVVFDSVREIQAWSLLELSKNGQRLVSPVLQTSKFKSIPSLWLGQPCREGIQAFAQNLASQVGVELLGGELMSLMIKGKHDLPDVIILLRCENESFLNQFNWDSLERYLSGLYSNFCLKETNVEQTLGNIVNPFELFQAMDRENFDDLAGEEESKHLITVDFSEIIQFIRSKANIRFYWNDFFKDFLFRFGNQYKIDLKVSTFNIGHIGVLANNKENEKIFRSLKAYVSRFPYWKYFEDIDIVMVREMPPKIKMIHYSSDAVLSMLDGQQLYSMPMVTKKKNAVIEAQDMASGNVKDHANDLKNGFFVNFEQQTDL